MYLVRSDGFALHLSLYCSKQGFYTSCDIHYFVQVVFQGADSGPTSSMSNSANHQTTEAFSITTSEVVLCKHPPNYPLKLLIELLAHSTEPLQPTAEGVQSLT